MTAIPTWDQFMAPVLRVLADGQVRPRQKLYALVSEAEQLSDEQRAAVLASGELKYRNRIGWATSYLNRAGAIARPERGQYVITEIGRQLLAAHPYGITEKDLRSVPGYEVSRQNAQPAELSVDDSPTASLDPTEQVEQGIGRIHADITADLLMRLHGKDPIFFEQAVVDLLVAMGYGGVNGRASVTQQSNDSGIDGIIDQDTLGLSRVYVQAKRYAVDAAVGRPELQAFVGALSGKADGGVFITTGRFSQGARDYANSVPTRVILIDGQRLAGLMIRYGVGVQVKQTFSIVEIDEDFFE